MTEATRVLPANAAGIAEAAALLRAGGVVAFPTETVYGLGANALDSAAVHRIYEAKGRPSYNPLIVHVADAAGARNLTARWPAAADRLAARWWPGPLTMVLRRAPSVPDAVTAGLDTVAIRVPAHPAARALLVATGLPLAAPSANRSGEVSPTQAAHVMRALGGRIPLILDGGPTAVGIESTVVDLSGDRPVLLRPGMVSAAELEAELGPLAVAGFVPDGGAARPSPGMLDRHYAPRAALHLYSAGGTQAPPRGPDDRVGAIVRGPVPAGVIRFVRLPDEPAGYAQGLYQALHELDDAGATMILVEAPPPDSTWDAIRDRLRRAARP